MQKTHTTPKQACKNEKYNKYLSIYLPYWLIYARFKWFLGHTQHNATHCSFDVFFVLVKIKGIKTHERRGAKRKREHVGKRDM